MKRNIKIIPIEKEGNSTVIALMTKVGSRHESPEIKGISHFVEHMCFKGTKKRTCNELAKAIEQYGGQLNAFTDWELTCYWAKISNQYTEKALDVILDLVTHPIFPVKEIDKEREVIIQELKMYEDDAKTYVTEVFNKTLYRPESNFYLPIIGTRESLYNIDRNTILNYYNHTYKNPTLVIIGDIKNKISLEKSYDIKPICFELATYIDKTLIKRNNITQANILIGNLVHLSLDTWKKIDQFFCLFLLDALYGDMSGRLFNSVREENHLVYRIRFGWEYYSNGSIQWDVSAGLNTNKIDKARDLVIKELTKPISKKDLEIILNKTIGTLEMQLDNIYNLGTTTAYSLIQGIDYNEIISNYKNNLKRVSKLVNNFIEEMNFHKNVLVGVIPKK